MIVGTVVLLTTPMLGNTIHTIGVCYETYNNGGASFIFENGEFDGFSENEQKDFLHKVAFSHYLADYHYSNVFTLGEDYRCDIFSNVLEAEDELRNQFIQKMRDDKIDSIV